MTSAPRSTIASSSAVKTHMPFCRSPSVSICFATASKVGSGQKRTVTKTRGPMTNPIEVSWALLVLVDAHGRRAQVERAVIENQSARRLDFAQRFLGRDADF